MKKLHFKYSAMNAGKSMHLIMTYHNYKELGLNPVAVIPDISKSDSIYSRTGARVGAIKFHQILDTILEGRVDCILLDEAQFLSKSEVMFLNRLTIEQNIPVICYGLRTTSTGEPFEGAKYLLAIADEIEELPTLCFCGAKARMNLRAINGIVDKSDEVVKLREEAEVSYISVCRKHFNHFLKDGNGNIKELIKRFDNTRNTKGVE